MPFTPEKQVSRGRVDELINEFGYYIEEFDRHPPFTDKQLQVHLATIRLRRGCETIGEALQRDEFLPNLYETLRLWGIGKRGSRLVGIS